jgi:hypothetical protein
MTTPMKGPDDGRQPEPTIDEEDRSIEAWEAWVHANKEPGEHKERRSG